MSSAVTEAMARIRHSEVLSREEHRGIQLHGEFRKRLPPLGAVAPRVLDWGCGRGSDVLHLRREGYDAYGVEPDARTVSLGASLFAEEGLDQARYVQRLEADNRTAFPTESFDFLMSYQVLEHVENIESAAKEMFRVMRTGATAVHLYPAHHRPVEGHLHMPFVHWLPKNGVRRGAIDLCVRLGVHPGWKQLSDADAAERTETYFAYSCQKTFYRPPAEMLRIFRRAGFEATFESHRHQRIERLPGARMIPRAVLSTVLTHFVGCVLVCHKPAARGADV